MFTMENDEVYYNGEKIDLFFAINETEAAWYAFEYGEPGYSTEKPAILFGDWNDGRDSKKILENLGIPVEFETEFLQFLNQNFELEWGDEWCACYECGKPVRTSGDSYGWRASYAIVNDCEVLCRECIDYPELLVEYVNNPEKAWSFDQKWLIDANFAEIDGKYHGGLQDFSVDPCKVYRKLKAEFPDDDIVFFIDSVEQFGLEFTAWKREQEENE